MRKKIIWGSLIILILLVIIATILFSFKFNLKDKIFGTKEEITKVYFGLFREGSPTQLYKTERFEKEYNFKPHIVMWYQDWNQPFPLKECLDILEYGAIPQIVWEPWIWGEFDAIRLQNILNGEWDQYIDSWAQGVKKLQYPIFIRLMHEFNIEGYSWSLIHNNKDPKLYIKTFRYVVDRFKKIRANNALWVWCPMNYSYPAEPWNDYVLSYPGDEYVDWIGIDGYNWGITQSWSQWQSFEDLFREPVRILSKKFSNKPIMIGEFASTIEGGDKAKWVEEIPSYLKTTLKPIKAIIWFDLKKETDWRIKSPPKVVPAFQKIMRDPVFEADIEKINTLTVNYAKDVARKKITFNYGKKQIDGNLKDWNVSEFVFVESIKSVSSGGVNWNGNTDLSAKAGFAWDEKYLYCAFDITDDIPLKNVNIESDIWNGDGVELALTLDPKANPKRTLFSKFDYQIGLSCGDYQNFKPSIWVWQKDNTLANSDIKVSLTNKGYILEAKIAWNSLNRFEPKQGMNLGFTFAVDDCDESGNRESQMLWSGDYLFYKDPSVWGIATLKIK